MLVFPNNRERPTPGNGSDEAVSAPNHLPEVWRGVGVGVGVGEGYMKRVFTLIVDAHLFWGFWKFLSKNWVASLVYRRFLIFFLYDNQFLMPVLC